MQTMESSEDRDEVAFNLIDISQPLVHALWLLAILQAHFIKKLILFIKLAQLTGEWPTEVQLG